MALTGYTRSCDSFSAGVKELYLIPKSDVTSFTLASDGSYSTATLATGKVWTKFEFEPHQCEWKPEGEVADNGVYVEKNTIEAYFSKLSQSLRDAIQSVVDASPCGMYAVVKEYNDSAISGADRQWLIGYNEKDGTGEPVRMKTDAGTTGKSKTDNNGTTLTLYCEMSEKAREITADIITA